MDSAWRLRNEACRTLLSAAVFAASVGSNTVALAWAHHRLPVSPPLPDIVFSFIPELPTAAVVSEVILLLSQIVGWGTIFLHQERWLVMRRVMAIASACYLFRGVCIASIQLPVPSVSTRCAPTNSSVSFGSLLLKSADELLVGLGLNLYKPRVLCGDLLFSGHTVVFTLCWLVAQNYTPRRLQRLIGTSQGLASVIGAVCLILARKHYTIDVLIAYFVCTRIYFLYHNLVANPDCCSKAIWWFPLFRLAERF